MRWTKLPLLFVLIVLATNVLAQRSQAPPSSSAGFEISGTVVNALSGEPLSEAQVAIGLTTSPNQWRFVTTGEDGRFDFAAVERGKYVLVGERRGFLRQAFNEHQQFSTAIATGPDLQSTNLVFRLNPEASISGFVTDDQNDPVPDAQILLFERNDTMGEQAIQRTATASTDDRGYYHIAGLRPGTYFIAAVAHPWYAQTVSPYGGGSFSFSGHGVEQASRGPDNSSASSPLDVAYPVTYYGDSTDPSGAMPLLLKPGEHASAAIQLNAVPALHLRVETGDTKSQPGMGVGVLADVFGISQWVPGTSNVQNSAGEVIVSGLAPGDYTLSMNSYGKDATRSEFVRLSGDEEIDLSSAPSAASISGVVFVDGKPASSGFVQLLNPRRVVRMVGGPMAKGEFHFDADVANPPGYYNVAVYNVRDTVVTGITATGTRVRGQQIYVGVQSAIRLRISMSRRLGQIEGVAKHNGRPEAGAMIVLVPENPQENFPLFRRDQSDSDGTFTLSNIVPGRYTLLALEHGWEMEWSNPAALRPYLPDGKVLTVAPDGKYNVQVNIQ